MVQEYIAKITGDTSGLEKVIKEANGKIQQLSDDEVLIKLNYDGNVQEFNKVFKKMLKAAPELTIQFQYDVNKKMLDQELAKLQQFTTLKMDIESGEAANKLKSMLKSLQDSYDNIENESVLHAKMQEVLKYANTLEKLGVDFDKSSLTVLEEFAEDYKSLDALLQKNQMEPILLFNIDKSLDEQIEKTTSNVEALRKVMDDLKKKGASEMSETDEFKELSDRVKILSADLEEMKQQLGSLSGDAFDDMSHSVDALEEKLSSALERIQQLREAVVNPNEITYHIGELGSNKKRWKSESINHIITNMNWGDFDNGGLGFGILGTGVYHTPDVSELKMGGANPKGYAIDISKYNLLVAKTNEEATRLLKFLGQLQGFVVAQGSEYRGWDKVLEGVDSRTLYSQFQKIFGETVMGIDEFDKFLDSMIRQMNEISAGGFQLGDNISDFKDLPEKYDHFDTAITQLLKKLGYEGIDLRGTEYDNYNQGNTIFDLHPEDIIKVFNTQQEMDEYWEKNIKATQKFNASASESLGEAGNSIRQLTSYVEVLNKRLNILTDTVNSLGDLNKITDATEAISGAAVEGLKAGQHSNSPSIDGAEQGDNLVDGYVNEVNARADDAFKAGENVSEEAVKGMASAQSMDLSEIAKKAFEMDMNLSPAQKFDRMIAETTKDIAKQKQEAESFGDVVSNAYREFGEELEKDIDRSEEFTKSIRDTMAQINQSDGGFGLDALSELHDNQIKQYNEEQRAVKLRNQVLKETEKINEAILDAQAKERKSEEETQAKAQEKISTLQKTNQQYLDSKKYLENVTDQAAALADILTNLSEKKIISKEELDEANKRLKQIADNAKKAENQVADPTKVRKLLNEIDKYSKKYTGFSKETLGSLSKLTESVKNVRSKADLKELYNEFVDIQMAARDAGEETQSMFATIGSRIKELNAKFIAQFLSWQDMIRYVRELTSNVVALDSALTELRKVSDASTERLTQSFEKSADTALELGQSVEHVINVTADWSRLGYDVDAAEELARVTALFTTVGDNMTADDASSYLISTLQGYQMSADQALDIVDKYNQVANKFAIDTAGIGEALQRSAASFNAANTDLSKSIALITATNEVIQNPESVGTLWKTERCLNVQ